MSATSTYIRQLDSVIWTFSGPFRRLGVIDFGRRCTVIKLKSGDLFCLSATPYDKATDQKIKEIGGNVKYLVAPNLVHYLYIKEWAKVYPDAKIIGIEGQDVKDPSLKFTGLIGKDPEGTKYGFEDEIEYKYFSKSLNRDTLFLHKPTSTMMTGDLVINLPADEQYPDNKGSWGIIQRYWIGRLHPFASGHRDLIANRFTLDKEQMKKDAEYVIENWKFTRIIPCHGDVYTGDAKDPSKDAKEAFKDVFSKVLNS